MLHNNAGAEYSTEGIVDMFHGPLPGGKRAEQAQARQEEHRVIAEKLRELWLGGLIVRTETRLPRRQDFWRIDKAGMERAAIFLGYKEPKGGGWRQQRRQWMGASASSRSPQRRHAPSTA